MTVRRPTFICFLVISLVIAFGAHANVSDELASCGGRAPLDLECETFFQAPSGNLWIGTIWGDELPYEGNLRVTVTGSNASWEFDCVGVDGHFLFFSSCEITISDGVFSPGELLSLRGEAKGAGDWRVRASTDM